MLADLFRNGNDVRFVHVGAIKRLVSRVSKEPRVGPARRDRGLHLYPHHTELRRRDGRHSFARKSRHNQVIFIYFTIVTELFTYFIIIILLFSAHAGAALALGANIGTCGSSFLAASGAGSQDALHVAIALLLARVIGVVLVAAAFPLFKAIVVRSQN